MRNLMPLMIVGLLISVTGFSQTGKVYDQLSHPSKILNTERHFAIYLPPDYETSQRSYPVLYLLHGSGDDHTGWVQFGEVLHIANKAINKGKVTPMIIVMPDAQSNRLGFYNDIRGDWNFEDYFFEELIPYVESTYRIKGEKRYRAVAGLSMGGGATFMYALHRPDMFSSAVPLSSYIGPLSMTEFNEQLKQNNIQVDETKAQNYFERHNALSLIESLSKEQITSVRWFIDCGDDDFLYEGNSLIHIALRDKGVSHEFRIRDGGHNWTYWRESLPEVLKFVSDAFHQY